MSAITPRDEFPPTDVIWIKCRVLFSYEEPCRRPAPQKTLKLGRALLFRSQDEIGPASDSAGLHTSLQRSLDDCAQACWRRRCARTCLLLPITRICTEG